MRKIFLLFLFSFLFSKLFSQELYLPLNIREAIDKGSRSIDGKPGKKYWQNFADYDLKIKFNPKNRKVSGSEIITYTNNSPDTLKKIMVQLYADFYKKGNARDRIIAPEDESDGVTIEDLIVNNVAYPIGEDSKMMQIEGTNMDVKIQPLSTGQQLTVEIKWYYTLNKGSHIRTGMVNSGTYFLGYPYPRIAVYDDIDGWDESPYTGRHEPYFDFGNITAEITVPKHFVVWATGELQNAEEVFQPGIVAKYKAALANDKITNVIDSAEADNKKVTTNNKWNTFKFMAKNVPDFAIGLSNHYMWQASGILVDSAKEKRILVNTVFDKKTKDFFEVNYFSRKTIEVMSFDLPAVSYPYPHITVFEGADQMEYPMMVNDNPIEDRVETIELTDHEIFHTFFPFYMGTNQRRYAWMDEGWATLAEWYISPLIDSTIFDAYGIEETTNTLGRESDVPLIVRSFELDDTYFVNAYPKGAYILLFLKDMLGDSLFRRSIQQYMADWHGKHPIPWDFFNSINRASGQNLNWYWKAWFYDFGSADLALSAVRKTATGSEIIITAKGTKPVPVYCNIVYKDGTIEKRHETAAIWANGNKEHRIQVTNGKEISKVMVIDNYVPDVNDKDNTWIAE